MAVQPRKTRQKEAIRTAFLTADRPLSPEETLAYAQQQVDGISIATVYRNIGSLVEDKWLLKLIRAFLNAGVMENGLVSPSVEGTPQGGPLSPLLSNLVLDELDRELEHRGHRFVRYAYDSNIYVRSERAGPTGDGEHHAIHYAKAQAQGE